MENKFCKNLKELRTLYNLTQKSLAEKLNVTVKTISHWESGYSEPSLALLKQLKEILNISYDDLLD